MIEWLLANSDVQIPWPEKVTLGTMASVLVGYVVWHNRTLHSEAREDRKALLEVVGGVREALAGLREAVTDLKEMLGRLTDSPNS